tara:strand:- start:2370 stop:2549 length:180 start_codon:yes stop_codon:yes gene_type:complete
MKCVDSGKDYRIFKNWILGIIPCYILEDSKNAVFKGGTWLDVKITKHYFKTLKQVKKLI